MYLEERVEQIEQVVVDHGRQIETVAKGLADLTTDVRSIRQDMTDGFQRVDERFDEMSKRFDELQQTQQLILKIITERL